MAGVVFPLPSVGTGRAAANPIRTMVSVRCSRGPAGTDPSVCFVCGVVNYSD